MFLGEAPGETEDETGKPFVVKIGMLLRKGLQSVGLNNSNILISNMVYWRPPGNRTPTEQEVEFCMPYVKRMIEIVKPKLLVAVGGTAANNLMQSKTPISKLRGKFYVLQDFIPSLSVKENIDFCVLFHPSYNPTQKKSMWSDILDIYKKKQTLDI
jgi:DNA polymerase